MVLSKRRIFTRLSSSDCKGIFHGLNIEALNALSIQNIFSKLCKACQLETMASIPPSAFSTGRIRETQRDMKVSKPNKGGESRSYFNTNATELSPLKYISMLMNSIWGQYNRYSPHNVKKINDANLYYTGEMQQSAASSGIKSEPKITVPSPNLDNVWSAINVSQSH